MRENEEFEWALPADFGDLVEVDGYDGHLFRVVSYELIRNCYPQNEWNEIVYTLSCVVTGEYLEADGEDVDYITDEAHTEAYIRENPPKQSASMNGANMFGFDFSGLLEGGVNMFGKKPEQPRKPTARELSAQEAEKRKAARKEKAAQIDNLLDERNLYTAMLERTNNEAYGDMILGIDAELKKLTEVDAE